MGNDPVNRASRRRKAAALSTSALAALGAVNLTATSTAAADPTWYTRTGLGSLSASNCSLYLCIGSTHQVQLSGSIYYAVPSSGLFNFYKDLLETTVKNVGPSSNMGGCIVVSSLKADHFWSGGSSSRMGTQPNSVITSTADSYLGRYTVDYKEANLSNASARMTTLVGTIGNYCLINGTNAFQLQYKG